MKLMDLLVDLSHEDLEKMAHEHARAEDQLPRPQLLATIESVLRSFRFLQEFILNRQPPTFAMLTLLLDAPEFALASEGFQELVLAETGRVCDSIDSRELLKRDDQLRIYRRVLYQARSNDMQIDSAESAILGVLRQELDIAHVEHFLIEHHADLREFWRDERAFERELAALQSAGLVFSKDGRMLLPEDLAPAVRQVLGIDMNREAARRLLHLLSGHDLHGALQAIGAASSGSKDERVERLIAHMAQPRVILRGIGLDTLRGICRDVGAAVSGAKDDLVDRIVAHLAAGRDRAGQLEPEPEPPPAEPRRLSEAGFGMLFEQLRGHELAGILGKFDLRRWGTKELQVSTLWQAHLSEMTLLSCLSNPDLEVLLRRLNLRAGGSKSDKIERLIEYFAAASGSAKGPTSVQAHGDGAAG